MKLVWTGLSVLLTLGLSGCAVFYTSQIDPAVDALPPAPKFVSEDRVLLVSPHPDDGALCCAGIIQHALQARAEVYIVWITSGDGFVLDAMLTEGTWSPGVVGMEGLGERRMAEARAASSILGVAEGNLFFLGYPDGGLEKIFTEHYREPYRSPYTGLEAVSYPEAVSPGASFTSVNLNADLKKVFEEVSPTVVLAPSPLDRHPDHRTTGNMTLRRLINMGNGAPEAFWWIVHGAYEWPLPKGLQPHRTLYPAPLGRELAWYRVDLTPEQKTRKYEALLAHETQMSFEPRFMKAFVRRNELLSPTSLPEQYDGR